MKSFKKIHVSLLLSCVAIMLAGCWGRKKKNEININYETSVSSKKKRSKKKWDSNLGAYVFEGGDSSEMLALNDDQENGEFQKIYFDFDRTQVRNDQKPALDYDIQLAKNKTREGKTLVILGKSDTHCVSEAYNLAVSQNRADTLAREFTVAGVSADKLTPLGLGDTVLEVPTKGKEPLNRVGVIQVTIS